MCYHQVIERLRDSVVPLGSQQSLSMSGWAVATIIQGQGGAIGRRARSFRSALQGRVDGGVDLLMPELASAMGRKLEVEGPDPQVWAGG